MALLEGGPQDILVRHTRSHVGDPGNEVADALAKHACRGGGAIDAVILHDFAQAAARSSFAWLWLLVEATRRPGAWPTLQYQALWDDPSPPPELPTPDECVSFFGLGGPPGHTSSGQARATICACLLTVNVQTLYPQDGDIDSDSPPAGQNLVSGEELVADFSQGPQGLAQANLGVDSIVDDLHGGGAVGPLVGGVKEVGLPQYHVDAGARLP